MITFQKHLYAVLWIVILDLVLSGFIQNLFKLNIIIVNSCYIVNLLYIFKYKHYEDRETI